MEKSYPNTGVLFSQKIKKSPKSPDYTGNITIETKDFIEEDGQIKIRIAGWKKVSKNGTTFLSLKADMQTERKQESSDSPENDEKEDLPF